VHPLGGFISWPHHSQTAMPRTVRNEAGRHAVADGRFRLDPAARGLREMCPYLETGHFAHGRSARQAGAGIGQRVDRGEGLAELGQREPRVSSATRPEPGTAAERSGGDLAAAVFGYDHSPAYVADVLARAREFSADPELVNHATGEAAQAPVGCSPSTRTPGTRPPARSRASSAGTPACGASGSRPACPLVPAIQFVGYDGYPGHGSPRTCSGGCLAHLHVSWVSPCYGTSEPSEPCSWVESFRRGSTRSGAPDTGSHARTTPYEDRPRPRSWAKVPIRSFGGCHVGETVSRYAPAPVL
jgi:hypothetical protein